MSYFVRMIRIGNWSNPDGDIITPDEYYSISSDAITIDLKTENNTLSLWEIDDLLELKEIAISLLTSRSAPQDLFVVAIPRISVDSDFDLENSFDGETAYIKFKNKHYNLLNLTYSKLGEFSKLVLNSLSHTEQVYDFLYKCNKSYIQQLVNNGDINKEELKKNLRREFN